MDDLPGNKDNFYQRKIRRFAEKSFPKESTINVLDLGCGPGLLISQLARYFTNANCLGIDGDKECIEAAVKHFGGRKNLQFEYQKIADIDTSRYHQHFDLITFCDVIEHLPNADEALKTIKEIAKPGGALIVSTDNVFFFNLFLKHVFYSYFKIRPQLYMWHHQDRFYWWGHHIYSFSVSHLATLMKMYGFDLKHYAFSSAFFASPKPTDLLADFISLPLPFFRRKIILVFEKTI